METHENLRLHAAECFDSSSPARGRSLCRCILCGNEICEDELYFSVRGDAVCPECVADTDIDATAELLLGGSREDIWLMLGAEMRRAGE